MLSVKQKKKWSLFGNFLIRVLFFLLLPATFTTAFSGVKEIFTNLGKGQAIIMSAFVTVLVVLLIYTVVFGRFFCGYACAFGSLGDAVRWIYIKICKKYKKKPVQLAEKWQDKLHYLKFGVLGIIAVLCFTGKYGKTMGKSPWDVFSMLCSGNLNLGAYAIGAILLGCIIIGMALCDRFFCRFLCPMGAFFSLLPTVPFFAVRRDIEKCRKGCSLCSRVCPANLILPKRGSTVVNGECFQCGKCIRSCPAKNAGMGKEKIRGNEMWFTLLRAVLLMILLKWAGV